MEKHFFLKVTAAEYMHDYTLKLTLNYFRSFTLDPFTVDWNNEIGFAPESLYERGVAIS